jgi:hypothetical protein
VTINPHPEALALCCPYDVVAEKHKLSQELDMIPTVISAKYSDAARDGFLAIAQQKVDARLHPPYGSKFAHLSVMEGPKRVRVVITDDEGYTSAFCFIDRETGNVLKAAGWASPDPRTPRSNINDADFGASGITGYGTLHLRYMLLRQRAALSN